MSGDVDDELEDPGAPTIDAARYKQVVGHFASGVTIVAAVDGGEPVGFTAQSFIGLSLEPPLVLVSAQKTSSTWPRISAAGAFCVNVLREDQEDMCRVFATKGADKFKGIGWRPGSTGAPVLNDALAFIECSLENELDGGDHIIAVGRVADLGVSDHDGGPLLFYRGGFGRFAP